MNSSYQALKEHRAYVDMSERGRIRVTGEDRARLIHALTTNHIQQMKPGGQVYAFFLNAQGRILSDAYITCREDHLLIDVPPEVRETIFKHIDHYIIADDVTLEDVTLQTFSLLAEGTRIYGEAAGKSAAISQLNLVEATNEDFHAHRVELFHPAFGTDFNSSTLPQETGLLYALHFNKGCYLGQEIVERIRSRGHVNKMLTGLRTADGENLPVGAVVKLAGEDVGHITSSAGQSAIAMLRIAATKPGTTVTIESVTAQVHAVS